MPRDELPAQAEQIVKDLHLTVATYAGADSDRWDCQLLRNHACKFGGNALEHDGERTGVLERPAICYERECCLGLLGLHLVAAKLVDRLRRQANVAHHRDAGLYKSSDRVGHAYAAFELDRVRARFGHEATGVAQRLLGSNLERHKRHVGDDQRMRGTAHDGTRVVKHVIHGDGQCRIMAENDHPERIAHENRIDTSFIDQTRRRGVVRGDHDDGPAGGFHAAQGCGGDGSRRTHRYGGAHKCTNSFPILPSQPQD